MSNFPRAHAWQAPLSFTMFEVCSNLCPLSWWCYLTILSHPLPFLPSAFPSTGVFSNELFLCIQISASPLVLPMIIQGWLSLRFTGLNIRDSQESSPAPQFKSTTSLMFMVLYGLLSHPYMTTGKTKALTVWPFIGQVMSLLFNTLSRFVIAFLQGANVF